MQYDTTCISYSAWAACALIATDNCGKFDTRCSPQPEFHPVASSRVVFSSQRRLNRPTSESTLLPENRVVILIGMC